MAKRGIFVVLEGLDRTGKTTQCQRLVDRIRSEFPDRVVSGIRFPDRTTAIGKMIDGYLASQTELDDRAVHLLFAANRWEQSSSILASLAKGDVVVCDRYAFSGIAFTAAKSRLPSPSSSTSPASPVPLSVLAAPDAGLPLPDVTVFLSISPKVQASRGGFGEERYEKAEIQAAVRKVFEGEGGVAEMVRRRHGDGRWVTVEADGSLDQVGDRIFAAVAPLLGSGGASAEPVGRLWED